jgi:hypothetical protein
MYIGYVEITNGGNEKSMDNLLKVMPLITFFSHPDTTGEDSEKSPLRTWFTRDIAALRYEPVKKSENKELYGIIDDKQFVKIK